eukprot:364280-Chlamydomonas_euryale.AAC.13
MVADSRSVRSDAWKSGGRTAFGVSVACRRAGGGERWSRVKISLPDPIRCTHQRHQVSGTEGAVAGGLGDRVVVQDVVVLARAGVMEQARRVGLCLALAWAGSSMRD